MNSSTSADLPIRRRPRTMTHLPGRAEPTSPRTSASIPSSRASSRRRPTKPAIAAPKTIPIDTSLRDTILIGSIHDQAVHPRCRDVPISVRCDVTPRPTTRARRPAISALPRIHGHHPAAGDPDDRPVQPGRSFTPSPESLARASTPGNTPVPQLPDDINGTDQALHSARSPSAEHHSPTTDSPPRDRKPGAGAKIPTKSPHHTRLTGPASTTRTSPRQDISAGHKPD